VKKIAFVITLFCFAEVLPAQADVSCRLRISLLTCSPGDELYSTFGHSALRVIDSEAHTDIVYNYGTFDFDDPSFYTKFARGKLLYFVSIDTIDGFLYEYRYFHRGVIEQVLQLSCPEKEKLVTALQENAKEENKYYKYDFIYDNCTTRLRDMVFNNSDGPVVTKNILPKPGITFRNLIHDYLNKSGQYWSKLGIDILLGAPLDKKVSNNEAMFLPDYLLKGFDSTEITGHDLVMEKKHILIPVVQSERNSWFTPFTVFAILFLIICALSVFGNAAKFFAVFDFVLFFLTGVLGVLLLFMWFGTDHPECKNNLNLAWAFPLHFIGVFFLYRELRWMKFYFLFNSVLLLALLLFWKWLPQELNAALIPVVCLLLLRSFARYKSGPHGR